MSCQLSAPDYINSLGLKKKDGSLITTDNYKDYLKEFLIASAHRALQEGCAIPDTIGFTFYYEQVLFMMKNQKGGNKADGRQFCHKARKCRQELRIYYPLQRGIG